MGVSSGSADFEINAFVDSFDKRLRVQHEINLAVDGALRDNGIATPSGLTELERTGTRG